jgi:hypothetical protein
MNVSFVHLRRILFGTSCAIVFGFGATQAFAEPRIDLARGPLCRPDQTQCYCNGRYYCVPGGALCNDPWCLE